MHNRLFLRHENLTRSQARPCIFMSFHEKHVTICSTATCSAERLLCNRVQLRTSAPHRAPQRPPHEAVPAQADEAAERIPAGLPRRTRVRLPPALVHICNTTQACVRQQQHIPVQQRRPHFRPACPNGPAHPHLFKINTHTHKRSFSRTSCSSVSHLRSKQ